MAVRFRKSTIISFGLFLLMTGFVNQGYSQNRFVDTITTNSFDHRSIEAKAYEIEIPNDTSLNRQPVMTGYIQQDRMKVTGSLGTMSGHRLTQIPVSNVSNTLGGLLPGLITITGSGEPGADSSTLRVRGTHTPGDNDPLVVIDGIPNRVGGLDRLNPVDIESITVLKDASAAIYGSGAANGVLLITTRRGKFGPPEFNIRLNQGFNQPARVPEMADAPTYLRMLNEIEVYRGNSPRFSEDQIQCHAGQSDPWGCPNTDWFSEALKTVSFQSKADLTVSGGSESITYFISLGGLTEDGYFHNSATRYNQLNHRSNIDLQVADDVQLQLSVSGRYEYRNFASRPAQEQFRMLMRGKPNSPAHWPNGLPGPDIENGTNPVVSATNEAGYNNERRYYLQSQLNINVEIPEIEGLLLQGTVAYDYYNRQQELFQKPWTLYFWDYASFNEEGKPDLIPVQSGYTEEQRFRDSDKGNDFLLNYQVYYRRDRDDHSYGLLAGTEYQHMDDSIFNTFRRYYPLQKNTRLNYYTRFNYDYRNRYLFEFAGRLGGSHMFPENGKNGFLSAVSAGWRISGEDWFRKSVNLFDELKFRVSWGLTGNDSFETWQVISPSDESDPDITWETSKQFNVGIDAGIFDNRISITFDYFHFQRSDILWWRGYSTPQPGSVPPENFGEVINRGVDGSVSWYQQANSDLRFDVNLSGIYAANEIRYLDESSNVPDWQAFTGLPVNSNLYFNVIGIFQDNNEIDDYPNLIGAQPGDLIFEDINGDGVINEMDMIRIGKTGIPEWTFGFDIGTMYRQFDIRLFFQGALGAQIYTQTESGTIGNFYQSFAENRWKPDKPVADHPRTWNRNDEYWASRPNTYFLRDTDYIRLKNLEIGYRLPSDLTRQMGIKDIRFYINGFNLLTFDKLKILDPEASSGDGQYYPQKRIFNAGLSVSF